MLQELKFQLSTAILTILTVAAAISAGFNFEQQLRFRLTDDGVTWVDRTLANGKPAVQALRVIRDSQAYNAGLRPGDTLLQINTLKIEKALYVPQVLVKIGAWNKADYMVERGGVRFKVSNVVIAEAPRDPAVMYQYAVGVGYLIIGLFVYFRRGSAQKARHFYILCLASFISLCFHYTGQFNTLDLVIYFGNLVAGLLAPTVFLHFCLAFPEPRPWFRGVTRTVLLYVPAALMFLAFVAFSSGAMKISVPLLELRWMMDRAW